MRSIAKLLERLCIEMGVDIRRSTKVERIEMAHQKVQGVHTKNAFFQSEYVICNQDVYFVYDRLLRKREKAKHLKKIRTFYCYHFLLGDSKNSKTSSFIISSFPMTISMNFKKFL